MPTIIDHLDLVDTQPERQREASAPSGPTRPDTSTTDRTMAALRVVTQRTTRVRAD